MAAEIRLGTVAEAKETLNTDAAGVFELVAQGLLRTERDAEGHIIIWRMT